jgi:hypothetical protein
MGMLISIVILIANIYAILKIVETSVNTLEKVVWIVLILVLPVIGFIVWFFFGPGKKNAF